MKKVRFQVLLQSIFSYSFAGSQPANQGTSFRQKHGRTVPKTQDRSVPQHQRQLHPHRFPGRRRRAALLPRADDDLVRELRTPPNQGIDIEVAVSPLGSEGWTESIFLIITLDRN